jgi:hypothetical protein
VHRDTDESHQKRPATASPQGVLRVECQPQPDQQRWHNTICAASAWAATIASVRCLSFVLTTCTQKNVLRRRNWTAHSLARQPAAATATCACINSVRLPETSFNLVCPARCVRESRPNHRNPVLAWLCCCVLLVPAAYKPRSALYGMSSDYGFTRRVQVARPTCSIPCPCGRGQSCRRSPACSCRSEQRLPTCTMSCNACLPARTQHALR